MSVKNFVQCGLVTPVAANTTELVLMAPTASYQYPPLDGGTLVIADSVARPSFYEIISYTHRIENVLYGVVRAKEGTTARSWSGVIWIYQALTAQDYVDALALKAALDSPALTGTPTAPTAALGVNTNQIATMAALKAAIDNLVGGAPGALDALNELAAALGNDPNFATTMTNALAGKEPSIAAGTADQMWLGNKTWASVLSQVQGTLLTGLGVGANTPIVGTDTLIGALAKIQNQLNNKADFTDYRLSDAREWTATEVSQAEAEAGTATIPRKWSALRVWQAVLASSLTGLNLTVGTVVTATDTVLVAIGKLQKQITDAASNLAGSVRATVLTGYVTGSAAALAATDTVLLAFGKLEALVNTKAPLDSPALTGNPTAPTPAAGDRDTSIATTEFLQAAVDKTAWVKSYRNFNEGTLIKTSIPDQGPAWLLQITGNSYSSGTVPFDLLVQGYGYNGSLVYGATGLSNGEPINGLVVFSLGGVICFWFPRQNYWQGFNVFVSDVLLAGRSENAVTSIDDAPMPVGATMVAALSPLIKQSWHTGNILGTVSQSGGIPTGAIIERGSNANGEYVRFADGTQICSRFIRFPGSGPRETYVEYAWPVVFANDDYTVELNPKLYGYLVTNIKPSAKLGQVFNKTLSTNSSSITVSTGEAFDFNVTATGRWY